MKDSSVLACERPIAQLAVHNAARRLARLIGSISCAAAAATERSAGSDRDAQVHSLAAAREVRSPGLRGRCDSGLSTHPAARRPASARRAAGRRRRRRGGGGHAEPLGTQNLSCCKEQTKPFLWSAITRGQRHAVTDSHPRSHPRSSTRSITPSQQAHSDQRPPAAPQRRSRLSHTLDASRAHPSQKKSAFASAPTVASCGCIGLNETPSTASV